MRRGQMALALAVLGVTSSMASAATLFVKFGGDLGVNNTDASNRKWNSVPSDATQSQVKNMVWSDNTSGPTIYLSSPADVPPTSNQGFNYAGGNANGPTAGQLNGGALAHGYIGTTYQSYGNTSAWGTGLSPAVQINLTGFDPGTAYNLYFFAGRIGASDPMRTTAYTVTGASAQPKVVLNASDNYGNLATVSSVLPDAAGHFTIDVRPDVSNTNTVGFYYLNVMEISSVPEPATMGLLGLGSLALLKRRRA